MEVSIRARQDFAIWKQIIDSNVDEVKIPRMSVAQKFFWTELMRLYNIRLGILEKPLVMGKGELGSYSITKTEPLLFYSGGLESSVMRAMFPTIDTLNYFEADVFPWTNPIEPALWILGSGLGYGTIFYGSELKEGFNKTIRDYRDFHVYLAMLWREYAGVQALSPISFLTKHDLFRIAIRDGIDFYSCFSNDPDKKWCGKCYKCLLVDMLYKIEGKESPIVMKVSEEDILSGKMGPINEGEISVYKNLKAKWEAQSR